MINKKKICSICNTPQYIWKSSGTGGKKICKACYRSCHLGIQKLKPIVKQKRISPKSERRIIQDKKYTKLRKQLLEEFHECQAQIENICQGYSTTCHHKQGRIGKLYTDYSKFLACCMPCHSYIEINPIWAKEQGFSLNRL